MNPDNSDNESSLGDEFTLMRADSVQTSDTESDLLLVPEGGVTVEMYEMNNHA